MRLLDPEFLNEVVQTISRNRRRSLLTALGVFWGTFMLVTMLGGGMGLSSFFREITKGVASNSVILTASRTTVPYGGMPSGRYWNMDRDDMTSCSQIAGVSEAVPLLFGRAVTASHGKRDFQTTIKPCGPSFTRVQELTLVCGRLLNAMDELEARNVCVLGQEAAERLYDSVEEAPGSSVMLNGMRYTVVGVATPTSEAVTIQIDSSTVLVPESHYVRLYNMADRVDGIILILEEKADNMAVTDRVRRAVYANHGIAPDDPTAAEIIDLSELFGKFSGLFSGVEALAWIVGLGTLLAALVGVCNIMLVVIRERTQEIGVRRAIGASPAVIITQVMAESFAITFFAGIMGLCMGVGLLDILGRAVSSSSELPVSFQISLPTGLLCAALVVFGSLLAGAIPAQRSLAVKAVDALRDE